jgi:hypothetical protein
MIGLCHVSKYFYIYQESFICKFCFVLKLYVQNSVNIQDHRNRISHHHYFQSLEVMNISKVLQHNQILTVNGRPYNATEQSCQLVVGLQGYNITDRWKFY